MNLFIIESYNKLVYFLAQLNFKKHHLIQFNLVIKILHLNNHNINTYKDNTYKV
jgi:hypothetical protein